MRLPSLIAAFTHENRHLNGEVVVLMLFKVNQVFLWHGITLDKNWHKTPVKWHENDKRIWYHYRALQQKIRMRCEMTIIAYLFAIIKNVVYGTTVFFTGELTASVDVLDVLALRFLMSFVVFSLLKVTHVVKIDISVKDFFIKNPRSGAMKNILLTALFEPVLYMLFETLGVSMTTGITAGVILSLSAVTSCIFENLVLKESSTLMQKAFLGIGIFGVIYIAVNTNTTTGENSVLGIVFLFLTVLTGSLFAVFSRKSSGDFSPMEITYISCLLGAAASTRSM